MNMTDAELLQRYVRDHSESAFEELVARHLNLVYSAALRQTNGDAHLAEDITQSVFTDLARKAAKLVHHTSLLGWLYTSTRYVAANARRTAQRRNIREQAAHAMNAILSHPEPTPDWSHLSPLLDEAMHQLDEQERTAVLLRHFDDRSYVEIGYEIGMTENAARKRVDRALEKLHAILAKQGVTLTVMALAGLLSANAVGAAPSHLAAKIASGALAGVAAGGLLTTTVAWVSAALRTKTALVGMAATLLTVSGLVYASRSAVNPKPPIALSSTSVTNDVPVVAMSSLPATNLTTAPVMTVTNISGSVLHLKLVTADSGKPIPMVPIDYRSWAGDKFAGRQIVTDRAGECDITYPTNLTELELTTRKEGFADTRLLWQPQNGQTIPTNYIVRVDWPVAIGGQVVDADGKPVAGAKVGWNNQEDPATVKLPQSHNFSWIETTTDENGRWRINRMAEEMISTIYGSARHSNYIGSPMVNLGRDRAVEKQLRDGTHIFKLGRAITVTGIVVDGQGNPVADADVMVGVISSSSKRTGKSQVDGTFSVSGCPPGKELVTAVAEGFAPTTVELTLAEQTDPIRLTLGTGKMLRLRVIDNYGTPIPNARLWYDCINRRWADNRVIPVQLEFNPHTDKQGRVVLTNAPDVEMTISASANGFLNSRDIKIRPDGEEHTITLAKALMVHGVVYDEATGQRIPKFRIVQGYPQPNPVGGTTTVKWSSLARFWLDYSGGTYSHTFEEGVIGGMANPGYVLKFLADGYSPFISRTIGANEGDVELNVTLRRANPTVVTVYKPNGQPSGFADIGLVAPGSQLKLTPGGFSRENIQSGGSLLRTEANGTFVLQPDDALIKVVAATPDGYGEAPMAALSANPIIQLQPWGRLEATCYSGGKPVSGREYGFKFSDVPADMLSFDFNNPRVTTDTQGKVSVDKLPPGQLLMVRNVPIQVSPGGMGWTEGEKTPFEIKPGETTTLNLGLSNYTVTARLVWPAGMQRQANWQISAAIHTAMPVIPPEIRTNQEALRAFIQTEPFATARKSARLFQATINPDDTLTAEEVIAGDYVLSVLVFLRPESDSLVSGQNVKGIAHGSMKLTVPTDPPSGSLDLGAIELKTDANGP